VEKPDLRLCNVSGKSTIVNAAFICNIGSLPVHAVVMLEMCVCVFRKDRITIQEKEREQQKLKDLEHEAKRLANERRQQTLKVQLKLLLLSVN